MSNVINIDDVEFVENTIVASCCESFIFQNPSPSFALTCIFTIYIYMLFCYFNGASLLLTYLKMSFRTFKHYFLGSPLLQSKAPRRSPTLGIVFSYSTVLNSHKGYEQSFPRPLHRTDSPCA